MRPLRITIEFLTDRVHARSIGGRFEEEALIERRDQSVKVVGGQRFPEAFGKCSLKVGLGVGAIEQRHQKISAHPDHNWRWRDTAWIAQADVSLPILFNRKGLDRPNLWFLHRD